MFLTHFSMYVVDILNLFNSGGEDLESICFSEQRAQRFQNMRTELVLVL